ncbi:MAG: hypothetical protein K0R21_456 [Anaerocolumna sp.]|jgi:tetratricopeptide (TPR) repeat protein|nr:hypothetical protein [Anaerocolumna sp.]
MKKIIAVLILLCIALAPIPVQASEGTTFTYTISVDGEWIRTQDAYLPGQVYLQGFGLTKPSDLFIKGDLIYISDTGNSRIVVYNKKTGAVDFIGEEILKAPKGLFVNDTGNIYVADYDAECVFVLSKDGDLLMEIGRPSSYLFSSRSRYKPTGVAVTSGNVIYVTGEGSYEGVMQFNADGEFQGYFAANSTSISFLEKLQELIFTQAQLDRIFTRTPRAIQNIDITDRDLLYSVTQDAGVTYAWREAESSGENNVKLHNLAGVDILDKTKSMVQEWNFVDIAAGPYGNSYALTYTGVINEYDSEGNLIFSFGGRAVTSERNGLFTYASAIDVDSEGFIYVLDNERGLIQVYYPTEFAVVTHKAIIQLESGNYTDSKDTWASLLKLNGMSRIAHNGYGKTLYYQQNYKEAMEHFYIADNHTYYSEAFWEIRDVWLNQNIGYIITGLLLLYVFWKIWNKKRNYIKKRSRLMEDLLFVKYLLRHPIDSFYYIKRGEKGSVLSATIIYFISFLVFLWDVLFRGFIFNNSDAKDTSLISVIAIFFIPCLLWVVGNYMVSSINEGEGTLRSVYIGTAYALTPYFLLTPITLLSTYILTLNEKFIVQFSAGFFISWSGAILFLGVMEIHNYTVKEVIKNLLITLFFMIIAVIAIAVLYIIWKQVWEFIEAVGGEVMYRAFY